MIYHIACRKELNDPLNISEYEPASLKDEGFIHCSPLMKVEESANKFFNGKDELVVLCIDEKKIESKILWEDLCNSGINFPHIYGKLNKDAVVKSVRIESDDKGIFYIPEQNLL